MWRRHWHMISIYSVAHCLVDFACAFLMFRSIAQARDWYYYILVYNFCAFAMQMPIGIVADKLDRNHLIAGAGCILVGAAYGLTGIPLVSVITAGLGNGMFHIGGGIDVLNISEEKSGALGVFVSPGAFGVYFGTLAGKGGGPAAIPVVIALLAAAGFIIVSRRVWSKTYVPNVPFSPAPSKQKIPGVLITVACLFLVVCLRSFVGLALNFPWKAAGYWGLALVCASVFGKTAGGFLSDKLGPLKTAVLTLGVSALLFLFPHTAAAGTGAVLFFNMTMPVTLWVTAKIFPGAKGFSFGLLTFALFLGFLPVYLGLSASVWLFAPAAAVSLALLYAGLSRLEKRDGV